MPFLEHRGGGKGGLDVASMVNRWDAEWAGSSRAVKVPDLTADDNWRWVQKAIPAPARVLEAGCGVAKWVAFLDAQGYETFGIDYSQIAVEKSLDIWPGLKVCRGDLRHLPYEDGFFDGIVSFGAIEHDVDGPEAALSEMHRVLRPGGTMYCTVPCVNYARRMGSLAIRDWLVCNPLIRRLAGRKPDVAFFEYVFTPKEYRKTLAGEGFQVLELVPTAPYNVASMGRLRRVVVEMIYDRWPWFLTHMVGAICRRPAPQDESERARVDRSPSSNSPPLWHNASLTRFHNGSRSGN